MEKRSRFGVVRDMRGYLSLKDKQLQGCCAEIFDAERR